MKLDEDEIKWLFDALDERCGMCGGTGGEIHDCEFCDGVGHILTPAGEKMLAWLSRWRTKIPT